jgi:hypothetical protein
MIGDTELERRIRERAHQIWLDEGCPDGRDQEHWSRAEQEIIGERANQNSPPLQPEPIGEIKYAQEPLVDTGEGLPPSERR